jgi:4-hydroxy-3-polyprenylbenzoate decarboxylase
MKVIVVVDEDVNVHDTGEVTWRALNAIDPKRDVVMGEGPVDALDHAARDPYVGSKMGIDATDKWPEEMDGREWPDQIRSDPGVSARIDALWAQLGRDWIEPGLARYRARALGFGGLNVILRQ